MDDEVELGDPGPYPPEEIDRISAVLGSSELSRSQLVKRLQIAALFYPEGSRPAADPKLSASKSERQWARLASALRKTKEQFVTNVNPDISLIDFDQWRSAAEELSRYRPPPNIKPELFALGKLGGQEEIPLEPIKVWPIVDQYRIALDNLSWLTEVTDLAARRAAQEKGPTGARPNWPKNEFLIAITRIFKEAKHLADNELPKPNYDPVGGNWHGELLDFVEACLDPLQGDQIDSRNAIAKRLERAVF